MSYCVNCGVELADYEKQCPLCHTKVINPNLISQNVSERLYPEVPPPKEKQVSPSIILALTAIILMLPIAICTIVDFKTNSDLLWSGYVVSSCFLLYSFICASLLVNKVSVVLTEFFDFTAILIFLLYINYTAEQNWYFNFALPIVLYTAISVIVITLCAKLTKISGMSLCGVSLILLGILTVIIELLISNTFFKKIQFIWSYYPFIALSIFAAIILFIDRNKPLKRRLAKKFFI